MPTTSAFQSGPAFIAYITCGDPDLETTLAVVRGLAASGCDLVELGIPFSDPVAEGPVIEAASLRALEQGVDSHAVLELVRQLRRGDAEHAPVTIPLVAMTYANLIFHYGIEAFARDAVEAGLDGLILPDVPLEEREEFAAPCLATGLDFIPLIAPTSEQRIARIAGAAGDQGFIYCVSSLGVTGVREAIETDIAPLVAAVRRVSRQPVAIGFGISTRSRRPHGHHLGRGHHRLGDHAHHRRARPRRRRARLRLRPRIRAALDGTRTGALPSS